MCNLSVPNELNAITFHRRHWIPWFNSFHLVCDRNGGIGKYLTSAYVNTNNIGFLLLFIHEIQGRSTHALTCSLSVKQMPASPYPLYSNVFTNPLSSWRISRISDFISFRFRVALIENSKVHFKMHYCHGFYSSITNSLIIL